jgi:hypothetical protein
MTRGDRSAERPTSDDVVDPLEEALRKVGADILDEPVPERLRQVLRQAQDRSAATPDPAASERRDEKEDREGKERH